MVISQPPGNNPSYYYRASPTLPQLLWMLPETPYVLYVRYNIRVTHRNGAIKHIFYTNQIHGGSSAGVALFILSLHALALHLAVKILLQILVWRFEHTLTPYIHLSVVFPSRMPAGPHFVTQPILLVKTFLIFDINHQQNCRRSDRIETIKTIMQTTRPRITWKVLPMARVAIFKEIFDQVRKKRLDCELFYYELKRHNVSHYIYYLATDNIHIVLENDNTVLIKRDLKKGCKC